MKLNAEHTLVILGMLRAYKVACQDRCNRWSCQECVICGTWRKQSDCLMGICPECQGRMLALGEALRRAA
jgi:hypothetical protein